MWQGIQGHDAVVEHFRQTLEAGRLATTYLFVGPEGVGKRSFALKFAQALLCTARNAAQLDPCGQCESCRLAIAGNHPDLDVISVPKDKRYLQIKQFVGEGDTRNREGLCHNISLRPMLGRRRVALIDDADWFTPESANCLLKTLEEPPPGAVIILIGTSRSRQLPTILSRSQVVQFGPLAAEAVGQMALAEGLATDAAAANRLGVQSEGSLARARLLADAELLALGDRFSSQWSSGRLDAARLAREIDETIAAAGKEADVRRQRLRQFLILAAKALRQSMRESCAAGDSSESAVDAIDRTLEAEEQLDRNANQATLVECWLDDLTTILESQGQRSPA